jgi:hypothetical protein
VNVVNTGVLVAVDVAEGGTSVSVLLGVKVRGGAFVEILIVDVDVVGGNAPLIIGPKEENP